MTSRIALLKAVDALLGRLAVPLATLCSPRAQRSEAIGSILLIRPGGIGDAVLLIPAIQAIRKKFPSADITVLAERRNAAAFQLCSEVNRVLLYDRISDFLAVLRTTYDVVIDTEQLHRLSAVVARLTRAPVSIGYGTNQRSRLFTHSIPYSHDTYEIDSFLGMLEPLGIGLHGVPERFLAVPDNALRTAASLLESLAGRPFAALFPGASIPERRWGADRFRQVAERLAAFGIPAVVVGEGRIGSRGRRLLPVGWDWTWRGGPRCPKPRRCFRRALCW